MGATVLAEKGRAYALPFFYLWESQHYAIFTGFFFRGFSRGFARRRLGLCGDVMRTRFLLCCFLCGLLLVGDGRRHAGALVLPVAVAVAGLVTLGVYAGVTLYSGPGPVSTSLVNSSIAVKNAVFGHNGLLYDAMITVSWADIATRVAANPSLYPALVPAPPPVTDLAGALPSSSLAVGAIVKDGANYYQVASVSAAGSGTMSGCPCSSFISWNGARTFFDFYLKAPNPSDAYNVWRTYVNGTSAPVPAALTVDSLKAGVSDPTKNAEMASAINEMAKAANPDHSQIPTNGITLADGTYLTMEDLLDTKAFQASADELAASNASREASALAAASALAKFNEATTEKTAADADAAAKIVTRDIALADAAADPTNVEKRRIADAAVTAAAAAVLAKTTAGTKVATTGNASLVAAAAAAAIAAINAKDAADAAGVDAVDLSLPAVAIFDTFIEPPPKKDIAALLLGFVTASPLGQALEGVVIAPDDAASSLSVSGLNPKLNTESLILIDFTKYHTIMASVGALAVLIAQGFSVFIVVKGV